MQRRSVAGSSCRVVGIAHPEVKRSNICEAFDLWSDGFKTVSMINIELSK